MGRWGLRLSIALLGAGLAACATSVKIAPSATFQWTSPTKRLVLIEPNVELSEMRASGGLEPRADWTETAKALIAQDIAKGLAARSVELVQPGVLTDHHEIQLSRLHGAVGNAVLLHLYGLSLPNKGNALDWTLGPGTNDMRAHYGADYALFVWVRDSYTTTGRAIMMLGAAMFGVGLTGGQQIAFASLVDLRTGNIVWFNRIMNNTGDLRTAAPAQKTVDDLLQQFPL
jgi:hypothetical protein